MVDDSRSGCKCGECLALACHVVHEKGRRDRGEDSDEWSKGVVVRAPLQRIVRV